MKSFQGCSRGIEERVVIFCSIIPDIFFFLCFFWSEIRVFGGAGEFPQTHSMDKRIKRSFLGKKLQPGFFLLLCFFFYYICQNAVTLSLSLL